LAIRIHAGDKQGHTDTPGDFAPYVDIRSWDPDNDDEGRPVDGGYSLLEGGMVVGDGTRDGFDGNKIRALYSLLEHAPELYDALEKMVQHAPDPDARHVQYAIHVLATIQRAELRYEPYRGF
jgi:hypothetical protein